MQRLQLRHRLRTHKQSRWRQRQQQLPWRLQRKRHRQLQRLLVRRRQKDQRLPALRLQPLRPLVMLHPSSSHLLQREPLQLLPLQKLRHLTITGARQGPRLRTPRRARRQRVQARQQRRFQTVGVRRHPRSARAQL